MENNENVKLTGREASKLLGIGYSSYTRLLVNYKGELEPYLSKVQKGRGKAMTYIEKKGLLILATLKNKGNNKVHSMQLADFKKSKVKLVEKATSISFPLEYLNDPIIALRVQIIENEKQLKELGYLTDNHEERILTLEGDTENLPMTQGQRERLNERLRFFCANAKIQHSLVWRDLHDITGRRTLNDYVFADYKVALGRLRENYKLKNLKW